MMYYEYTGLLDNLSYALKYNIFSMEEVVGHIKKEIPNFAPMLVSEDKEDLLNKMKSLIDLIIEKAILDQA